MAAWLALAQRLEGSVSIAAVGAVDPCLYGCLTGIAASALVTGVLSLVRPAHYDWATLAAVRIVGEDGAELDAFEDAAYDPVRLQKAARLARWTTLGLFLAIFIVWPLSMYGSGYIFSKQVRPRLACSSLLTRSRMHRR